MLAVESMDPGEALAQVVCDAVVVSQDACTGAQETVAVQVDGSGSSDPAGGTLAYIWTSDCPGADFDDPTSASPALTVDVSQLCSHQCTVTLAVTSLNGLANCGAPLTLSCDDPNVTSLHTFAGNGQFGHSVDGAGDVNNDGVPDLIIGAVGEANLAGRAYVFSGQDYSELRSNTGENDFDQFGIAVAGAGDVNHDGYDDWIVGALLGDDGAPDVGTATVFSGQDGSPIYTFYGDNQYDHFGVSVDGAGDFNGDGYVDFIVGAQRAQSTHAGEAIVFSGLDGSPLFTSGGISANDNYGNAVAGAGDVDNNGYDDFVVGAHVADVNGVLNAGMAEVYGWSGQGQPIYHFAVTGSQRDERTGAAVAGVGDVNDDGYDDVLVSSTLLGLGYGHVDMYSGATGEHLWRLDGNLDAASFGRAVDGLGDVNGDGRDDVVVGAAFGSVGVYSGDDGALLGRICPVGAGEVTDVAAVGDLTGDGVGEVLVGMQFSGSGGQAVLYNISAAPPNQPPVADAGGPYTVGEGGIASLDGSASSDPDGDPLTFAWDLDGDGSFETLGAMPVFSAGDGPATQTVVLEVCDSSAECSTDDATINVQNLDPTVYAGADETLLSGETLFIVASFTDPWSGDTHTATIDFGMGAGPAPAGVDQTARLVTGSARYFEIGTYQVEVCVTDDNAGSGCDGLDLTVGPYPIAIDIKPGSDPNSINLGAAGVIPVAILGTAEFEPWVEVDTTSLLFSGASVRVVGRQGNVLCHSNDVNGDGFTDRVCQFENALDAQVGDSVGTLLGRTLDGRVIQGEDSIRIVPQ